MEKNKNKNAIGSGVCIIVMMLGGIAFVIGIVVLVLMAASNGWDNPYNAARKTYAFTAIGAGAGTYILGAILHNLCEITVSLREILIKLDGEKKE